MSHHESSANVTVLTIPIFADFLRVRWYRQWISSHARFCPLARLRLLPMLSRDDRDRR